MIHLKRLVASSVVAATVATGMVAVGTLVYAADKPVATKSDARARSLAEVERAKDLLRQGKLAEAKAASDNALKIAPDLLDARVLNGYIADMIEKANKGGTTTATAVTTATAPAKAEKVTAAQINRIRAYEVTEDDRNLAGAVDRKTLDEFWKQVVMADPLTARTVTADDREAFFSAPFYEKVLKITKSRQNQFVDRLVIRSEPAALAKFSEVNTWVVNSCAFQAGCHAMENSKDSFRIYTRGGSNNPENIYTNLMIMQQYRAKQGAVIDRDRPEESLIVQYSLPPRDAKWSHPENKKVLPRMTGANDSSYKRITGAISKLNKLIPENYGLDVNFAATPAADTEPAKP